MCYLVLKEQFLQDLVAIEKRSHLVPSRTQKLSSLSADIAKSCLVKYARRQLETHCNGEFFLLTFEIEISITHSGEKTHYFSGGINHRWMIQ